MLGPLTHAGRDSAQVCGIKFHRASKGKSSLMIYEKYPELR